VTIPQLDAAARLDIADVLVRHASGIDQVGRAATLS